MKPLLLLSEGLPNSQNIKEVENYLDIELSVPSVDKRVKMQDSLTNNTLFINKLMLSGSGLAALN